MKAAALLLGWLVAVQAVGGQGTASVPRVLPGMRDDGYTRLHSQWLIHPVGDAVEMGDFPVGMAVNPAGTVVAVLHAGYGQHEVRMLDLGTRTLVGSAKLKEAFCGIAFSSDGTSLVCSGGSEGVLHVFPVSGGQLGPPRDIPVVEPNDHTVVAGVALSRDARSAIVALAFDNRVVRVDLASGALRWTARVGTAESIQVRPSSDASAPNGVVGTAVINSDADPLNVAWDEANHRAYAGLWGQNAVAVIDTDDGRVLGRLMTGLHPNEMLLTRDGRLLVSNGGLNTVTVVSTRDGSVTEVLSSAAAPGDLPGSTPDSLALSPDGRTLYVANASTNTLAVFDIGIKGAARALGALPTGWFPSSVRLTPDGRTLLVLSARGLVPKANAGHGGVWPAIGQLYAGSLGILAVPRGEAFGRALAEWTKIAMRCRPAAAPPATAGNPVPGRTGGPSPIRYVIYIIKENRTYDQVLGDLPQGNGDAALCLFPERITPNIHALARQFVLLDNFYANAEVSASGHEWSMAGYSSEFVEKTWPTNYGHHDSGTHVPYPAEGHYAAALPALGYLWDRAAAAGVTYRSYGEFTENPDGPGNPVWTNLPALKGHLDPRFRGWDQKCQDRVRADEFIAELHRFEAAGDMPRLQIVRLPQDHTAGAKAGEWTPQSMVADNDRALGRVVEALSHSRFWRQTVVFAVEDDAQSGPDHVDAHRTEALLAGAYVKRAAVDSTAYTTCSMLRTIELILGLQPMSQFDAAAAPMWASFAATPDMSGFSALEPGVSTELRNPANGALAAVSSHFDFSKEDRVDDLDLNRVIWAAVRDGGAPMPAPVRAAFVRQLPGPEDD